MSLPRAAAVVVLLALGAGSFPVAAEPSIHMVRHQRVTLEVRPLTARALESAPEDFLLVVERESPAELELHVLWPDADRASRLKLSATRSLTTSGERVQLAADLFAPDGRRSSQATREILFTSESTTALFEIARENNRVLTLAIDAELSLETSYTARPVIGAPVQFELEIQWVDQGQPVTLETNRLSSFVGQSVSYSFKLGETGEAESVNLRLMPARIFGDTMQIEVDVSGTLPDGDDAVSLVGRQEQWLATRNTTSALSLAEGEPPTGFVFLVTPRF